MWFAPPPLPWWTKPLFWVLSPLIWYADWRDRRWWEKYNREQAANGPHPKPVPTVGAGWFIMPVPWWLRVLFWRPWK